MTNTFRYKNVSLSVFLNAQLGQTANNWLYDVSHNSYRQNRLMVDFWTPENPTNKYPKNSLDTSVNPMSAGFLRKDRLPPCAGCHAGLPCSSALVKEDFPEPPRSIYEHQEPGNLDKLDRPRPGIYQRPTVHSAGTFIHIRSET